MALILSELTNNSGAGIPSNSTCVPATCVPTAPAARIFGPDPVAGPRADPIIQIISPGATEPGCILAPFTIAPTEGGGAELGATVRFTCTISGMIEGSVGVM